MLSQILVSGCPEEEPSGKNMVPCGARSGSMKRSELQYVLRSHDTWALSKGLHLTVQE